MTWGSILAAYVLIQIAGSFWTKIVSMADSRTERLVLQYLFCSIYALFGVVWKGDYFTDSWLLMFCLGIFNALACYSSWRAFEISLSGGGAFLQAYSFVAILVAAVFLGEWALVSPWRSSGILLIIGIFLNMLGTIQIILVDAESKKFAAKLVGWASLVVLIWGVSTAILRYQASVDAGLFSTVLFWYVGSLLGAVIMRKVPWFFEKEGPQSSVSVLGVACYSLYLFSNIYLVFWLFEVLPLTYAQPIMNGVQVLVPVLVGAGFFGERALLSRAGLVGLVLILTSQLVLCYSLISR